MHNIITMINANAYLQRLKYIYILLVTKVLAVIYNNVSNVHADSVVSQTFLSVLQTLDVWL